MAPQSSPDPEAPVSEWIARFVADIPSAVALFDRDMRYAAANNRWLNAFGVVGEGVIGQCHEQIDPASATLLADLHRRALAGETAEASLGDDDALTQGASHRIVCVRAHHDRDGTILGVVATVHEALAITTEKSLQYETDALTGLAGRHCFMER